MTPWLTRVSSVAEIEALRAQVELGLARLEEDPRLEVALQALMGDLWALQQHYHQALDWWERANRQSENGRLLIRRLFGMLRLDDAAAFDDLLASQQHDLAVLNRGDSLSFFEVFGLYARNRSLKTQALLEQFGSDDLQDDPLIVTALIDNRDWPGAASRVRGLGRATIAAKLVRAWVQASLDDIDDAALAFAAIMAATESTRDGLSREQAKRGLAFVAERRSLARHTPPAPAPTLIP
jgi:hypothetical protein